MSDTQALLLSKLAPPSRKWFAAQITAVATFLTAGVDAGDWNKTLSVAFIGLVAQALVTYVVPNGMVAEQDAAVRRTARSKARAARSA